MENVFELPDKKKMVYYEWRTERPVREGSSPKVIVCVHGITMFGLLFDFLAKGLIEDAHKRGIDCRVYAVDLLGRGNSEWIEDPAEYKAETYVGHMISFIEEITKVNHVETVDYIGTSLGGMIAMGLFYIGFGKKISKVILNDVGAVLDAGGLTRVADRLSHSDIKFSNLNEAVQYYRAHSDGLGILSDDQWRQVATYGTRKMNDSEMLCLKRDPKIHSATQKKSMPLWVYYEKIDCPVLVIHGVKSDFLKTETIEEMKIRGKAGERGLVQSVDIQNAGHAPALNTPQQIEIVAKFFFEDSINAGFPLKNAHL